MFERRQPREFFTDVTSNPKLLAEKFRRKISQEKYPEKNLELTQEK